MRAQLRRWAGALLSAAAIATLATGCSKTVEGTALPAGSSGEHGEFRNLLTECDAVGDQQIADAVGAEAISRTFFGAICRWDASGPSGRIKVVFNWFETGSLEVERQTNEQLGYGVEDTTIEGRRAILLHRPGDGDSCGVSAGAPDQGVIGWWVHYRPGSPHPDPCDAARKLAELTLSLSR
ncbi:DUF3558 domain-containing protein [Aldersonia sp. NBC_00410]|jgi:Protein of unknown function (DUF3558)|uniref:DUF3558 domain-containing protein n=1 Tax=Aldersonia sp. NBC_00410 TaxID=2975954 RepID=UPI00225A30D9|nr:DUF3558 domain-containing protein [Aldersonia sp. NBC_00410]MCX5041609.1 DUF3558 domain-containing protein [Aldersonia sp. NBC_00410]